MGSAKRHDASVQSADPTRDELDETFEILDRDGAVVVFGGDLMERGFGIVSAKATEDTRLSSSAKGVYAYFCAHAGAGTHSLFPSVDTICTHLAMSRNTYYRHRRTLVECGYISVHQGRAQGQGRYLSNRYVVNAEIPEERRFVPVDNSKSADAAAVENSLGEDAENEVINNPQDSPCTKNWYTGDQTNVSLQLDSPCTNFWYTGPTGKTISPCTNFCDTNKDVVIDVSERGRAGALPSVENSAVSKAAGDSVTVVKVASEAGLGLETEVSVSNAEVLALMRMSIGKAEVFADVAEAYARVLADGWTLPRIGRAYDTYRREYAASHTDGRYIMSLPKFLAAGNGLRFYDLRADLVDSGAVAAAEEKAAPSKAPTREQVRNYVHEKGYDAPDPDNPAYRVIDPDEFFDYYEATGWVRAGGVPIVRWKNVVNTWRRKPAPRAARKFGPSGPKRAMSVAERVAADSDFSEFNDD